MLTPMRVEELIAQLFRQGLALYLSLLILFLRMLVNFFSKDVPGIFRRIFSLPEDMIFVAMSLDLAGVAGVIPSFTDFYIGRKENPVLNGAIWAGILFLVAWMIHIWDGRLVQPRFQEAFIAHQELDERDEKARVSDDQQPLPGTREYAMKFITDYMVGAFFWLCELSVAGWCLKHIAQIVTG